jgi:hypothetical protein
MVVAVERMRAVHHFVAGLAARIANGHCITWHRSLPWNNHAACVRRAA